MSVRILQGDCREVLAGLAAESVHCVVTSPPYWGLRDYGIAPTVWGGDAGCEHDFETETVEGELRLGAGMAALGERYRGGGHKVAEVPRIKAERGFCCRCGAWRGAHGLEPTIDLYVRNAVEVFRAVHRVLRSDGTLWLNLGDSYAGGGNGGSGSFEHHRANWRQVPARSGQRNAVAGLKPKDLVGTPWRVAFALQADGWWLRQDIIWAKPNPMPESITDRCTKAHEYLFLLSKSARYYFDADAIAEPASDNTHARTGKIKMPDGWDTGPGGHGSFHRNGREKGRLTDSTNESYVPGASPHTGLHRAGTPRGGRAPGVTPKSAPEDSMVRAKESWHASTTEVLSVRNKRSVWTVATSPFPEAHFATFPPDLIEPCIKAGTSEKGCCAKCGAPWERGIAKADISVLGEAVRIARERVGLSRAELAERLGKGENNVWDWEVGGHLPRGEHWTLLAGALQLGLTREQFIERAEYIITGSQDGPKRQASADDPLVNRPYTERKLRLPRKDIGWRPTCKCDAAVVPATVLDCFGGAGTTGLVADRLQRNAILIELNPQYAAMASRRIHEDAPLFAQAEAAE